MLGRIQVIAFDTNLERGIFWREIRHTHNRLLFQLFSEDETRGNLEGSAQVTQMNLPNAVNEQCTDAEQVLTTYLRVDKLCVIDKQNKLFGNEQKQQNG